MPSLSSLPVTCLTVALQTITTSWKISFCESDVLSKIGSCGHVRQIKLCMSHFCLLFLSLAADPPMQLCCQQSRDARG